MKRICVYCGSNYGTRPAYRRAAAELGTELARRGLGLVYGGSHVGLMGALADATLAAGGEVVGVIPGALVSREIAHPGLSELRVVGSMQERKALMADLSDAFIALPGGFGTLEEFCEVATWTQLGLHRKACGLLDVERYFTALLAFLDHAAGEGFIRREHRSIVLTSDTPGELLDGLSAFQPPALPKWIGREER
ncbi:MAG: TIGR00730 family Rossman fold protein [Deltaproteobacteria bacterium]|nr:TIGR00730 family Rossman fold protein [Deltaproteobacteria bacterium]